MSVSIADVLGLKVANTPMALIRQIEEGLPLSAFDRVTQHIAPGDLKFRLLIIPKATWTRRKKDHRLSPSESEIVARLARVWEKTVEIYGNEETARRFLNAPHPLLDGRTPMSVALTTSTGATLVEDILGRLQYGSAP
jgi:putative toxin-antitoxin system antitoxin component (TIGR02293 family)